METLVDGLGDGLSEGDGDGLSEGEGDGEGLSEGEGEAASSKTFSQTPVAPPSAIKGTWALDLVTLAFGFVEGLAGS